VPRPVLISLFALVWAIVLMLPGPLVGRTGGPGNGPALAQGGTITATISTVPAARPTSNGTYFWENLTASVGTPPSNRSISEAAYSPALNETILFGGYNGAGGNFALGDTWEYSHGQWTELQASGGPSPRWGSGFVYDAADGYLLLFGGRDANQTFNDTWMYNVTGWHEINTTSAPSVRFDSGVAYDAADGYVVLFGGAIGNIPAGSFTGFVFYNDTWTYRAGVWTNITATAGAAPAARRSHQQMTYDAADGYVLLTGGYATQPLCGTNWSIPAYAETWTFVGGHWTQVTPTGASPPQGMGAVWYDSQANQTMYYEAMENLTADACPVYSGEVWSYSAGTWALVTGTNLTMPPARILPVFVDDVGDQQQVLFGGESVVSESFGHYLSDTWSYLPTWVTFEEHGLPGGTRWQVSLGGSFEASRGPSLLFVEPPGAYTYEYVAIGGSHANLTSGSGSVNLTQGPALVILTYQPASPGRSSLFSGAEVSTLAGAGVGATAIGVWALAGFLQRRARLRREGEELVRAMEARPTGAPPGRHR